MKKYSKKQIVEAIQYWEQVLKRMDEDVFVGPTAEEVFQAFADYLTHGTSYKARTADPKYRNFDFVKDVLMPARNPRADRRSEDFYNKGERRYTIVFNDGKLGFVVRYSNGQLAYDGGPYDENDRELKSIQSIYDYATRARGLDPTNWQSIMHGNGPID